MCHQGERVAPRMSEMHVKLKKTLFDVPKVLSIMRVQRECAASSVVALLIGQPSSLSRGSPAHS